MKGIRIDSETQTLTEIELGKNYKEIYPHIGNGCQLFECPYVPELCDASHSMFIDEEGWIKATNNRNSFFIGDHHIAGNAVILGLGNGGNSRDCTMTIDQIRKLITFIKR